MPTSAKPPHRATSGDNFFLTHVDKKNRPPHLRRPAQAFNPRYSSLRRRQSQLHLQPSRRRSCSTDGTSGTASPVASSDAKLSNIPMSVHSRSRSDETKRTGRWPSSARRPSNSSKRSTTSNRWRLSLSARASAVRSRRSVTPLNSAAVIIALTSFSATSPLSSTPEWLAIRVPKLSSSTLFHSKSLFSTKFAQSRSNYAITQRVGLTQTV